MEIATGGIHGAAMGDTTARLAWPAPCAEAWGRFERATPELTERMPCTRRSPIEANPRGRTSISA